MLHSERARVPHRSDQKAIKLRDSREDVRKTVLARLLLVHDMIPIY